MGPLRGAHAHRRAVLEGAAGTLRDLQQRGSLSRWLARASACIAVPWAIPEIHGGEPPP